MKRKTIIGAVVAALLVAACATTEERAQRRAERAEVVKRAVDSRHFTVTVQTMNPMRGSSVNVTPDFSLEVSGDTVKSYLPYFGRAYYVPYGGGKGLCFTATAIGYEQSQPKRGDRMLVTFACRNEEDLYRFRLEIYDDGATVIDVRAQEREHISFTGEIDH